MNIADEIDVKMIKKVLKSLEKKATGYDCVETTEEYISEDGKDVLVKRKITKHHIPADISATKILLEFCGTGDNKTFLGMSDEELDNEAIRLFKEYQNLTDIDIYQTIKGEKNASKKNSNKNKV